MTKILYKYRSLNENTKDILINNQFWYANVASLNDPNEGIIKEITAKNAEEFIRKTQESQISGFIFHLIVGKHIPENKRTLRKLKNLQGFDRKYKFMANLYKQNGQRLSNPEGFLESINKMIKNVGILSLSDNPTNTLMWSHYADNHKGIIIGIRDFPDEAYQPIQYVQYSEIPEINLKEYISVLKVYINYNSLEIGFNDPSLQAALTTKTYEWTYEKEWRGVKEKSGLYPLEGQLSEIVFGLNCIESDREEIRNIIANSNHSNVDFKEIYKNPNSYELLIRDC